MVMKGKYGTVLMFGAIVALILTGAAYALNEKHTGSEDVCTEMKEHSAKMVKAPVPIWEKVIKLLVRI